MVPDDLCRYQNIRAIIEKVGVALWQWLHTGERACLLTRFVCLVLEPIEIKPCFRNGRQTGGKAHCRRLPGSVSPAAGQEAVCAVTSCPSP
jgi:hypothetical protein